jgi:hypothetical protein
MSNQTPENGYYVVDLRSLKISDAEHKKIEAAIKNAVIHNLSAAPGAAAHTFAAVPGGTAGMVGDPPGGRPKS